MSAELIIALTRGILLLLSTVVLPGALLERLLVRSRHLHEALFLTPVLGTVATASVATSLAFLLGTTIHTGILAAAAFAPVLLALVAVGPSADFLGWPEMPDRRQSAALLVMLALVATFHWSIYDASDPTIYSRCSFRVERYLLGLKVPCRQDTGLIAFLPPPQRLPEDMTRTCPGDPACPYLRDVAPGPLRDRMEAGEAVRLAHLGDAQFGYPVLLAPYLVALRFAGFHVFYLLTRVLCALGLYVLVRRVVDRDAIALLVGALVMLNPVAAFATTHNENMFAMVLATAAVLLSLDHGRDARRRVLVAGMVLGALMGVRHFAVVCLPAVLVHIVLTRPPDRRLPQLALLAVGAGAALLPYMYWHQFLFGDLLTNELAYKNDPLDHTLPLLGTPFRSRLMLNWPFHTTLVRPAGMPFPTPVLLLVTLLRTFGLALSGVGVLGLIALARERRALAVTLLLWFLPAVMFMGAVTDWFDDKCTYLFIVMVAPAVWVAAGLDRLMRGPAWRDLALVAGAAIVLLGTVWWAGGMALPPDDRIPVLSESDAALERDRAAWATVPLLHGGLRPFAVRPPEDVFWSPPFTIFRWSDVLTFNDDRLPPTPCVRLLGYEGEDAPADVYVLNTDRIWQSSLLLATNQVTTDRPPFGPTSPPPNIIVVSELRGSTPDELDDRIAEIAEAALGAPVLLVLGEVSANAELATGAIGFLSPVVFPTGVVETGHFKIPDGTFSRPDVVRSRARPALTHNAEVVWRYADDVLLAIAIVMSNYGQL